jgi:hypothetical protein
MTQRSAYTNGTDFFPLDMNPPAPRRVFRLGPETWGRVRREVPVNEVIGPYFGNPVKYRRDHRTIWRSQRCEHETVLPRDVSFIIILVLSLGMWWGLWLAISALASAVFA